MPFELDIKTKITVTTQNFMFVFKDIFQNDMKCCTEAATVHIIPHEECHKWHVANADIIEAFTGLYLDDKMKVVSTPYGLKLTGDVNSDDMDLICKSVDRVIRKHIEFFSDGLLTEEEFEDFFRKEGV